MEILSVLVGYLLNGIRKNKATDKIVSDILDPINEKTIELWEKIKPEFTRRNKNLAEQIELNPEDQKAQHEFSLWLQDQLKNDHEFRKVVTDEVNKIQQLEKIITGKAIDINVINSSGSKAFNIQNSSVRHITIDNQQNKKDG